MKRGPVIALPVERGRPRLRVLAKSLVLAALLLTGCNHQSELPKLFPVPAAQLVDERGKAVQLAANKGYVTVYDFIFTNCGGTCPLMTASMRNVTKKIARDAPVRFVSISVDPARDTPAQLAQYAKRVRNDDRWTFLTGDRTTIVDLSVKGFKLAAGDPQPGGEPLLHSSKFAIADREGIIRAYIGATDDGAVQQVKAAVDDLVRE
ncbi:MAG: Cytochrome oxidase biosis protein Sco1/SenC/PrrC, putative copper metallochaperone [Acidobacteria bacterium]|nr:Cytochrome oxidase biosis protein Sco1/SenC/PrrC, putative copper metallochaperone [Acidobacteriota bacterium]